MPLFIFYYIILSIIFVSDAIAQSEVHLSIRAGGTGLTGVAVEGFESSRDARTFDNVKKNLEDDLDTSGIFQVKVLPDSLTNNSR